MVAILPRYLSTKSIAGQTEAWGVATQYGSHWFYGLFEGHVGKEDKENNRGRYSYM
jgi:hypothetical protein